MPPEEPPEEPPSIPPEEPPEEPPSMPPEDPPPDEPPPGMLTPPPDDPPPLLPPLISIDEQPATNSAVAAAVTSVRRSFVFSGTDGGCFMVFASYASTVVKSTGFVTYVFV